MRAVSVGFLRARHAYGTRPHNRASLKPGALHYVQQVETSKKTGTVIAAAGEGRAASASRPDFAAGAVAVLLGDGHEGKVYELSGDHAWDFNELAGTIARMIGRPVTHHPVDALALIEILKGAGMQGAGHRNARCSQSAQVTNSSRPIRSRVKTLAGDASSGCPKATPTTNRRCAASGNNSCSTSG